MNMEFFTLQSMTDVSCSGLCKHVPERISVTQAHRSHRKPRPIRLWYEYCSAKNVRNRAFIQAKERVMSTTAILLVVLVILLLGGLPAWPYSRGWGYYPSGILGIILVVVLIMMLVGAL